MHCYDQIFKSCSYHPWRNCIHWWSWKIQVLRDPLITQERFWDNICVDSELIFYCLHVLLSSGYVSLLCMLVYFYWTSLWLYLSTNTCVVISNEPMRRLKRRNSSWGRELVHLWEFNRGELRKKEGSGGSKVGNRLSILFVFWIVVIILLVSRSLVTRWFLPKQSITPFPLIIHSVSNSQGPTWDPRPSLYMVIIRCNNLGL